MRFLTCVLQKRKKTKKKTKNGTHKSNWVSAACFLKNKNKNTNLGCPSSLRNKKTETYPKWREVLPLVHVVQKSAGGDCVLDTSLGASHQRASVRGSVGVNRFIRHPVFVGCEVNLCGVQSGNSQNPGRLRLVGDGPNQKLVRPPCNLIHSDFVHSFQ